jgi:S1-C subfamily serine protease
MITGKQTMDQPSETRSERWRGRLKQWLATLKRAVPFASGVLAALVALFLYNAVTPKTHQLNEQDVSSIAANTMASATPPPAYSAQVYQVIRPSLVLITDKMADKDGKKQSGLGSGVVITDQGDILTSLHVVDGASDIQVIFADGTQSSAKVASTQPENDIAVLHADKPPAVIVPAVLGNPRSMSVGDEAYVVGNPLGLYSSMSSGVISGFERTFQAPNDKTLKGLIQIDAAVNPGNSGGPLLNRAGQVVGIVVGIVNPTGQDVFIGIGFAVPINVAAGAAGSPLY